MRRRILAGGVMLVTLLCGAQEPVANPFTQHLRDGAGETAQGDLSGSMAEIQSAIALHPEDAAGWYQLGMLLGQTGDFAGAEVAFQHAIRLQPGMAKAHYSLALTLIGNPQNKEDWLLEHRLRGKSISDVYEMSVADAVEFFTKPAIAKVLQGLDGVGRWASRSPPCRAANASGLSSPPSWGRRTISMCSMSPRRACT